MIRRRKKKITTENKAMGKIKHKKTEVDGIIFDSKTEANYYIYLKEQKEIGNVIDFTMQDTWILQPKYIYFNGIMTTEDSPNYKEIDKERKKYNKENPDNKVEIVQAIKYKSDFDVIYKDGTRKVEDVKGIKTADFKIKEKMFKYRYPHIKFECVVWDAKSKSWMEYDAYQKSKKEGKKNTNVKKE